MLDTGSNRKSYKKQKFNNHCFCGLKKSMQRNVGNFQLILANFKQICFDTVGCYLPDFDPIPDQPGYKVA